MERSIADLILEFRTTVIASINHQTNLLRIEERARRRAADANRLHYRTENAVLRRDLCLLQREVAELKSRRM